MNAARNHELVDKAVAVKNVVAKNKGDAVMTNEVAAENKGMGEADRSILYDVTQPDAPLRTVAEQVLVKRQMLARRNEQNISNACEH